MERYTILNQLGKGRFGTVAKAIRKKDNKAVAIKEIDYSGMDTKQKNMIVSEVNILKEINNKYVVKYIDRIINKSEKLMYIVMEYCENGDLQEYIRQHRVAREKIEEGQIWQALAELALALKDCHCNSDVIIHRDIKPGNIFIDENCNVKLGDFGLARTIQDGFASTVMGTPYYMSPELIEGKPYNEKSDIWALGCVIYEMAELQTPFIGYNNEHLALQITAAKMKHLDSMYSNELNDIVAKMLDKNPEKRPSVTDILENHHVKCQIRCIQLRKEIKHMKAMTDQMKKRKESLHNELGRMRSTNRRVRIADENYVTN